MSESEEQPRKRGIVVIPQQPTHAGRAQNEKPEQPEQPAPHRPFVEPDFSDPE